MLMAIMEYIAECSRQKGNARRKASGRSAPGHTNSAGKYVVAIPKPMFVTATVVINACSGEISRTIPVASLTNTGCLAVAKN